MDAQSCTMSGGHRLHSQGPACVLEWQMVTVASLLLSSSATGIPTMLDRPTCIHTRVKGRGWDARERAQGKGLECPWENSGRELSPANQIMSRSAFPARTKAQNAGIHVHVTSLPPVPPVPLCPCAPCAPSSYVPSASCAPMPPHPVILIPCLSPPRPASPRW